METRTEQPGNQSTPSASSSVPHPSAPFALDNIPMRQPCVVYSALASLNQQGLQTYLKSDHSFSRDALLPVVQAAARYGIVKTVQAVVPGKGVQSFVDLATFQAEFDRFVAALGTDQAPLSPVALQTMMAGGSRNNSTKRKVLQVVQRSPWLRTLTEQATSLLLPVAERFCSTPEAYVQLAAQTLFRPSQIRSEICGLLHLLQERQPQNLLEIGTNRGGTLYLFARHAARDARLLSVDLHLQNESVIRSFGRGRQQVELLAGDSTAATTIEYIRQYFPEGIDFVLLDGDHSYEGISQDYQNYAPMVKPGGIIAFHDIVEDNETRYGVITGGWAGGVPQFWREIREQYDHVEFIDNPAQDGLGIGVLFVPAVN